MAGKIILMQTTVDWIYKVDKNAVIRFEELGFPEVVETELGVKYYRYD